MIHQIHQLFPNIRSFLQQDLLQTADVLQADLQEALEASRTLTDLLEPSAASLVQSELRLLSRDLQEISWRLNLKLGQLQVRTDEVLTVFTPDFKTLKKINIINNKYVNYYLNK